MNTILFYLGKARKSVWQMPNMVTNLPAVTMLFLACLCFITSQGQQTKNSLQLADQYFAAGEYYTAAKLYDQFLHPSEKQKAVSEFPLNVKSRRANAAYKSESRINILIKQAESYRLANYWQEAAAIYKICSEEDGTEYKDAFYWHAVCERSLGNYAEAEESLKNFLGAAGINNQYKKEAEKELQTIRYIRQQMTRPDSILYKVQKLNAPNSSEKGLFSPVLINKDQFLVSSTVADSLQVNGVNPYHSRLFYMTLNNGTAEKMTEVSLPGVESMTNQGAASISADGQHLYFTEWKKENGQTVSAIYFATKQSEGWTSPVLLSAVNTTGYNSKQPFCSTDGKYLFFSSDRPGGSGKFDIWYAVLNSDGTTGRPVNAGTIINTVGDEQAPFYHNSSATLVFSSNGRDGMGGYDLFSAKGGETKWEEPANLGNPVNSQRDDIYFFAQENTPLLSNAIISSDRGTGCCLETYIVSKEPKNKLLTGIVYDQNDNTPVPGAEVIMKDISGKTWKTTTGIDGKYVFDLAKEMFSDLTLSVSKELYKDTVSSFQTKNTDESDFLTDLLTNTDLYIEKKPEPKPQLVIKVENVVTVYFDFDRSSLKTDALAKLDSIYQVMVEYPSTILQVSGYTDGLGSDEYNKILSDKRAKACADYLIQKGIDESRISFESFGACCPVEMELINGRDNPDGRSRNRRALINVQKD